MCCIIAMLQLCCAILGSGHSYAHQRLRRVYDGSRLFVSRHPHSWDVHGTYFTPRRWAGDGKRYGMNWRCRIPTRQDKQCVCVCVCVFVCLIEVRIPVPRCYRNAGKAVGQVRRRAHNSGEGRDERFLSTHIQPSYNDSEACSSQNMEHQGT